MWGLLSREKQLAHLSMFHRSSLEALMLNADQGFSVLAVDVLSQIILCYAAVLSIFSSIPRLYLLDARAPSSFLTMVTAKSISRKCQVSRG